MRFCFLFISLFAFLHCSAQKDTVIIGEKIITLSEVILDGSLDVPAFIHRIKEDSSFYKAFRNLHILGFTSINDIRMNDKKGRAIATLRSKTRQNRKDNCRTMDVLSEEFTGDIYDKNRELNYYTARMYASLFFTSGKICGENNIVAGTEFSTKGKHGMEKHKEQLKMLFFNPGRRISGLPFISNKTSIFDDDMANLYDMEIRFEEFNSQECYVFYQKVKPGRENRVVINEMTSWFNSETMDIVGRNYSLSYDAGVYDFDVTMEVIMENYLGLTVPRLIRYVGDWKAITKKRERGVFTAILYDFNAGTPLQ